MKKITVSIIVILAFIVYSLFYQKSQTTPAGVQEGIGKTNQPGTSATVVNVTPTQTSGMYKDGTYTGTAADAYYGYIQVKAVISGGKLVDVQFLQYPSDQRESIRINTEAMPLLKQEALQAQSANVDIVSHATDSSQAFQESLASALSQAK